MIRVNLLPPEYRRAEATPVKQFFATMGSAALAVCALAAWAYVHFAMLQPKREQLVAVKELVQTQEGQVKVSKDLQRELAEYQNRTKKIDEVAKQRLVWSRKLDELWEVLVNPRLPGRYEVWIASLTCQLQPSASTGGMTKFGGISAGEKVNRLSDFHEDVTQSPFFADYFKITQPSGAVQKLQGDREPALGWKFDFTLQLKPLETIWKERQAADADKGGASRTK